MDNKIHSLFIDDIPFFDAPSEIEGSPYWVDLLTEINGYFVGLQVKPKTYNSASMSIYTGKGKSSQLNGHKLFKDNYGGKVFIISPEKGIIDEGMIAKIKDEVERLKNLPKGPHKQV